MEPAKVIASLREIVGENNVLVTPTEIDPYLHDWRKRHHGRTICVVRPRETAEVAAILRLASDLRLPVYPQGGNTSVCGGSVPAEDGHGIVVSLTRMNRILEANARNNAILVQGGCVLQQVQEAAAAVDRLFPLSLGAEGSCQIGGNLATNAGGTGVLRYGNMRDLVLGLEVVLAGGRVLDVMRTLRKDNSGYDLKNLFVGSEGTLGIITGAALKLFPRPAHCVTAMLAGASVQTLVDVGLELQQHFAGELVALELISSSEFEIVMGHAKGVTRPFAATAEWYLLVELTTSADVAELAHALEACIGPHLATGVVDDAVVASSEEQRANLWRIRHSVTESNVREGMGLTHDIAVPVFAVPAFLERAGAAVAKRHPTARVVVVGHLGDGNLHYIVMFSHDEWAAVDDKGRVQHELGRMLYDIAFEFRGTFSAEHGIGSLHLAEMARYKPTVELGLMREIKTLLDPHGIMNPGRVLPDDNAAS
jgi:D-lactate dehydrogenase (cytochrome)